MVSNERAYLKECIAISDNGVNGAQRVGEVRPDRPRQSKDGWFVSCDMAGE
jgi:hypothetical protein